MKKTLIAAAATAVVGLLPTFASAQAAAPAAPAPDWTITANVGLFTEYRFRGISQTNKKPAIQGGFDVAHSSGFYLGNWNSNIDSAMYNGANIEMDFYGGYKMNAGPVALDFGGLYYYYPGSNRGDTYGINESIKNFELYVGATFGPATLKLSYPLNDFFSAEKFTPATGLGGNAAGSYYADLSATQDIGSGFALVGHVGYQKLKGAARLTETDGNVTSSYVDWKLGATYNLPNSFVLGASYVDTNREYAGVNGKKISGPTLVVSLSKTF